jgi:seryl-tRNA synthetase
VLDLKWVVENREQVWRMLGQRGEAEQAIRLSFGLPDGSFWSLDSERRRLIQEVESLRHEHRKLSEAVAHEVKEGRAAPIPLRALAQEKSNQTRILETQLRDVEAKLRDVLLFLPNVPDATVPVGPDAGANQEVRRVGEPPRFDFAPK